MMQRTTQRGTEQRGTAQRGTRRPGGFTLLEILVVVSIIAALIAISVAVYGNMMESARRAATMVTISKADKLLQQQITAWSKEFRNSTEIKQTSQHPVITNLVSGTHAQEALALKFYFKLHFPQNATEAAGFDGIPETNDDVAAYRQWLKPPAMGGNMPSPADSSELLYLTLTEGRVRGATAVDTDSFTGRELADTDGDGFVELVDGWGNPLRFYRWPTRLLHPFGFIGETLTSNMTTATAGSTESITVDTPRSGIFQIHEVLTNLRSTNPSANVFVVVGREIMEVTAGSAGNLTVVRGARSTDPEQHSPGAVVQLAAFSDIVSLVFGSLNASAVAHDTDDPRGDLLNNLAVTPDDFEVDFHTLDSFHTSLIVSAGTDGELGLLEPFMNGTSGGFDFGNLAMPDTRNSSGTFGADFSILADPGNSTLNDNLTNQMEGLGN